MMAEAFVRNWNRYRAKQRLFHTVDRRRGY
jgi:hypothetical protein